jgi:hypothetical protein
MKKRPLAVWLLDWSVGAFFLASIFLFRLFPIIKLSHHFPGNVHYIL